MTTDAFCCVQRLSREHGFFPTAAARADNFYHPPDWDPRKESLDQHHGSHPLRERARKLDQGILIIRFEMPYNVWCQGCGDLIGKGVRFNAEKKQTGQYHSTKVWSFTMKHHCGCKIVVRTDPKSCEYLLEAGAHRKEESFRPRDAQVIELPDEEEKARLATDPLFRMEREKERLGSLTEAKAQVAQLVEHSKARGADGADVRWNRELKRDMRIRRREEKALDKKRQDMGLSDDIKLLPETVEDIAAAKAAMAKHRQPTAALGSRRKAILNQDIFKTASKKRLKTAGKLSSTVHRSLHNIASTRHKRHKVR